MPTTLTVRGDYITVELLLWRHGKRRGQSSARLTETLALNPGLSRLGPYLPLGTKVVIPDLPPVAVLTVGQIFNIRVDPQEGE